MNSYSRKHDPARQDSNLGPPQKRWRDHFASWVMVGILTVFSLGALMPISSLAEDDGSIIDVMVVYTENAKSVNTGSSIEELIRTVVGDVNKSYEDSGVTPRLTSPNQVHIEKLSKTDYDESNRDLDTILDDLTNGIGDVHKWRDRYFADVVVLLVGDDPTGDGVAKQMTGSDPNFENSAFAVVKVNSAKGGDTLLKPYSFAHQLGHLMGCTDNNETIGGKKAIMNNARIGLRINRWSDSCATILNDTAKTVANFRYPKPGTLQFSLASQNVNENVGTVTIEVTRTDGKNGQVSVDMKLASWGNATVGSDYTFTSPLTLTWNDWDDTPKKITVPIIDDDDMENSERAVFTLSRITGGATIGTRTTTVTITDNDGADIAYVIDVTGSMGFDDNGIQENGEITRAAKSLTDYTQLIVKQIESGQRKKAPDINFLVFRDDFRSYGITNDLSVVQERIDNLYAAGGDDCPEGSVEAMREAARKLRPRGQIMLFTDADPHPDLEIDDVIAELNKKGLRVHVKLTGVCKDTKRGDRTSLRRSNRVTRDGSRDEGAIEVFSRIAFETGGSFAYIPEMNDGSASNGTRYENSIFNTMVGTDEPAIIDIAPSTVPQGGTLDLVLTATNTNFNDSSLVTFATGIVVNELEVISATQIIANVTVPSSIAPEFYNVSVKTRMGSNTETAEGRGPLLVVTPKGRAELLSVAPFTAINGTSATVNISGLATRFDETSTVSFGSGIKVQDLTVQSPTLMTATLDITSDAKVGLHQVVVETGDQSVEKTNAFLVLSAVVNHSSVSKIRTVTPSEGAVGSTLEIDILGKTASFSGEESILDFSGTGISVLSLEVMSATHAIATIAIDNEAALGYRDVFISTGEETATLLNGFEIADDVPEIKVKPNYASQGENQEIEIFGQHIIFVADKSIVDIEGTGVSILSSTVESSTQITANIQVDKSAKMGERNISVITGSEIAVLRDGFKIFAETAPVQLDPLEELAKANLYAVWGLIVDESGNPIVDVALQFGEQTATTDENGFWHIYGIVEGSYTIVVTKDGYTFAPKEVKLGNQAFITEVTITLGSGSGELPDSYTVFGHIFNEDGNPMAGV
ncbi:MAG: Calx-beta domain-containing protein, partial [Candidatus Parabeggiatoa sp.]|nr:Calx-beta domain-containing protein [Candidatus Parabeggiatoa sp.]